MEEFNAGKLYHLISYINNYKYYIEFSIDISIIGVETRHSQNIVKVA